MVLAAAIIGQAANERAEQVSGESGPRIDLEIVSRNNLPFADSVLSTLRASPDVELAAPSLKVNAAISNLQSPIPDLQLLGVDSGYTDLHKPELADGAFLPADNSIVLPVSVAIRAGLRTGGIAVFQTESPFYSTDVLATVQTDLRSLFKHVAPYVAHIPTYPSGLWSFTFASDAVDPRRARPKREPAFLSELKYLTPELVRAAFVLPAYVQRRIGA